MYPDDHFYINNIIPQWRMQKIFERTNSETKNAMVHHRLALQGGALSEIDIGSGRTEEARISDPHHLPPLPSSNSRYLRDRGGET